MHNVRRFLQDASYETSQDARARAASEGNLRPEDVIPIYRKRTTIDSSGRETESQSRYVNLSHSVYSLRLIGALQLLRCRLDRSVVKVRSRCLGSCDLCNDDWTSLAVQAVQVE